MFEAHLAEQNAELNFLSMQHTDDLIMNLINFHSMPKNVRERIVDKYRALANKYWLDGKVGDKLDAAHALDSVAGGYLSKFIGLRDSFANQQVGRLWKSRWGKIEPGKLHNLIPRINTEEGLKAIEEFFRSL